METNICKWCDKIYKRKENLLKHEILCEIHYKQNTDNIGLPSMREMFELIAHLTHAVEVLERKVETLEKTSGQKRKKTSVITLLNERDSKPEQNVFDFMTLFCNVCEEQVTSLLTKETKYVEVMEKVIANMVSGFSNLIVVPLVFASNRWFVFKEEWQEISKEDWCEVLEIIKKKILRAIMDWKLRNGDSKVDQDMILGLRYNNALLKIMKVDCYSNDTCATKQKQKAIFAHYWPPLEEENI